MTDSIIFLLKRRRDTVLYGTESTDGKPVADSKDGWSVMNSGGGRKTPGVRVEEILALYCNTSQKVGTSHSSHQSLRAKRNPCASTSGYTLCSIKGIHILSFVL
jgi:hypothetical protein